MAEHIIAVRQLAVAWQKELELSNDDLVDVLALIEIHDWPKLTAGDAVILGDEEDAVIRYTKKKEAELDAMHGICADLRDGEKILSLYKRFIELSDRNGIVAKEIGLFQALILAEVYEVQFQKQGLLKEFIYYTKESLTVPFLKRELEKIVSE